MNSINSSNSIKKSNLLRALNSDNTVVEKILKSKVLVVGAGGIGCELLKNLVLTGFQDIEIVKSHFLSLILRSFFEGGFGHN